MHFFPKEFIRRRGIIYDHRQRAILNNTILYDLMVTPSQVKMMDTAFFCQLLEIDTAEFRSRILDARIKNGPFRPSIFEDLLEPDLYAKLEENIWRFPGFNLQERPVRVYPYNAAAHIMGYVGEVDSNILRRSNYYYQLGDYVGRSGLEQFYEKQLMGQRGIEYWIKDNKNRLVGHYAESRISIHLRLPEETCILLWISNCSSWRKNYFPIKSDLLLPLNPKPEEFWQWLRVRIMIPIHLPDRINKKIMDSWCLM